jgi:hypothetical protein
MKVTMTGRPMKDGQPAAIWVLAVTADGKKYDPREGFGVRQVRLKPDASPEHRGVRLFSRRVPDARSSA